MIFSEASAPLPGIGRLPYGWKKLIGGIAFCALSIMACFLLARRLTSASWPLQQEKQKLERPPLGQHLQLPCEVFRQLKRGLVLTAFLASHSTAGHQRSGMAKFSLCTMPLCTPREDV